MIYILQNIITLDNQQPFVVIEMDEPQRKYITNYGESSSPNWNEHYDLYVLY